jgi:hypothetical protein
VDVSLADLASIGTLASSVAVFVSLIYLTLQMRQNTKHTKALIHQGRIERIVDMQLRAAEPSLAAAIIAGSGGEPTPDAVRQRQFNQYCWAVFMSMEDTFDQRADGLIGPDQFGDLRRGLVDVLSEPGIRAFFDARADGSPFARFVGEVIATLPPPAPDRVQAPASRRSPTG